MATMTIPKPAPLPPPWAQSNDPDLAEKNKYLGPVPSHVRDED